jgi:hypothetical protein
MATQFQTFKKNLVKDYIKQGKTLTFIGALEKQKDHWDAFVAYKCPELIQWVQRNKENALKKKYHHSLGQDGYKVAIPKWEKMEQDLFARGITLATINWPECQGTGFMVMTEP